MAGGASEPPGADEEAGEPDADRPALSFGDTTWTYRAFDHAVERMAAVLHQRGVGPGVCVGYLSLNRPECLFTLLACARLGAIFVPLNFRLSLGELKFLVADASLHVLVAGPEHVGVVDAMRPATACPHLLAIAPDAGLGWTPLPQALASAGRDGKVRVWDAGSGRPLSPLLPHGLESFPSPHWAAVRTTAEASGSSSQCAELSYTCPASVRFNTPVAPPDECPRA